MKSVKIVMTTSVMTLLLCMLGLNVQAQSSTFSFIGEASKEKIKLLTIDILPTTTANDLEGFSKEAKEQGVTLSFGDVKRNNKGEITNISATYKTKDNVTETYKKDEKGIIEPFYFYFSVKEKDKSIAAVGFKPKNNNQFSDILFVVNGQEVPKPFDVGMIDPDDIEAINVLKNESAIAKYGARAKNGVIEITLK
ncbi:MAG: TonB-dependent receptor plug domain-containing protein [Cellulophaga sp.]|uniref:TonB-dependent receptor plug domain-containing protein n=1 Tax=Cellulophaga sp. TaxID=1972202 RepID=UPI00326765E3